MMINIELCTIEFKKSNQGIEILSSQQFKSIRINSCILNDQHLLVGNDNKKLYFDFSERRAYLLQLFFLSRQHCLSQAWQIYYAKFFN